MQYVNSYISQRKKLANLYLKYLIKTNLKLPKPNKYNHFYSPLDNVVPNSKFLM